MLKIANIFFVAYFMNMCFVISGIDIKDIKFNLKTSDFRKIIKTTTFQDKTPFLEEFLDLPEFSQLSAPEGFGKSTLLDMIRRFFEIPVTEEGVIIEGKKTENYIMFEKLKIGELRSFMLASFGEYPIIFIDYKRTRGVKKFDQLLERVKEVVRSTYKRHKYLLRAHKFWDNPAFKKRGMTLGKFQKYIHSNESLTRDDVEVAFKFLCQVLRKYYGKNLWLLVDDIDAYSQKLLHKSNDDVNRMYDFMDDLNYDLFSNKEMVERIFITSLHRSGAKLCMRFCFLYGHPLTKYLGFNKKEVEKVIDTFVEKKKDRKKVRKIITKYYGGYKSTIFLDGVYNIVSVLKYLRSTKKAEEMYKNTPYFKLVKRIMLLPRVANQIGKILTNKEDNIPIRITTATYNLTTISKLLASGDTPGLLEEEIMLLLLSDLGYIVRDLEMLKSKDLQFMIPNREKFLELRKCFLYSYMFRYSFFPKRVSNLQEGIHLMLPNQVGTENFKIFHEYVYKLFADSQYIPSTEMDLRDVFFNLLTEKFKNIDTGVFTFYKRTKPKFKRYKGFVDLIIINDEKVAILIKFNVIAGETIKKSKEKRKEMRKEAARLAHAKIIKNKCHKFVKKRYKDIIGQVFLAIAMDAKKEVTTAFSFEFMKGTTIDIPKFVEEIPSEEDSFLKEIDKMSKIDFVSTSSEKN